MNCLPFVSTWVHAQFLVGSMLLIFLVFCVVFFVLFVFVLCLVYPVLPVLWIVNYWLSLWFSLTFIYLYSLGSIQLEDIYVTNEHGYAPLVVSTSQSFSHSWLITRFVTRVTWQVPLIAQELVTLTGAIKFTPGLFLVEFMLLDL